MGQEETLQAGATQDPGWAFQAEMACMGGFSGSQPGLLGPILVWRGASVMVAAFVSTSFQGTEWYAGHEGRNS